MQFSLKNCIFLLGFVCSILYSSRAMYVNKGPKEITPLLHNVGVYEGFLYSRDTAAVTWAAANKICADELMTLVRPNTIGALQFLHDNLNYTGISPTCFWTDGRDSVSFHWGDNTPTPTVHPQSDSYENCVILPSNPANLYRRPCSLTCATACQLKIA